ncbi:MAG: hypothetical protein RLZZ299_1408, partial [Pseudomonadota bacterium]
VVNDFGTARIDATLLGGAATLTDIPGGCVCCTAPEGLADAVAALVDAVRPDRIFIEPSGVARPQDVLDMLRRGPVASRVALQPTVVLVDAARLSPDAPGLGLPPEVLAQVEAADVLLASRADLADAGQLDAFDGFARRIWPPLRAWAAIAEGVPCDGSWGGGGHPPPNASPGTLAGLLAQAAADGPTAPRTGPHACDAGCDAHGHGVAGASRAWPADVAFDADAVRRALEDAPGLLRAKGLLHTDAGWLRLDLAGGRLHAAATGHRSDSRVDVILGTGHDPVALLDRLDAARARAPDPADGTLTLVAADGRVARVPHALLASLPGQVADVAALVPGRPGRGVRLASLCALATPAPDASVILVAGDGMTSAPVPVAELGDTVLVHATADGGPLPEAQGGPLRVLVPEGRGRCANVKGVVRVVLR